MKILCIWTCSILPFRYSENLFTQFFISCLSRNQKDQGKVAVQEQKCVPSASWGKGQTLTLLMWNKRIIFWTYFQNQTESSFPLQYSEGSTRPSTAGFRGYDHTRLASLWGSALPRNRHKGPEPHSTPVEQCSWTSATGGQGPIPSAEPSHFAEMQKGKITHFNFSSASWILNTWVKHRCSSGSKQTKNCALTANFSFSFQNKVKMHVRAQVC